MRIFASIIVSIVVLFIVIMVTGYVSPVEYSNSKSTLFEDKPEVVWGVVTDIEKYLDRKKDIEKLEIVKKEFGATREWKEYYSRNEILDYKIIRQSSPNLFIVNVKDDFRKIDRDIEYYIEQQNNETRLIVSEVSTANHIFWRGVTTLLGRDNFIDRQLKWVRVALFQNLLNDR